MGDGRRLLDAYAFSYVSAGRDVLRFAAAPLRQPTSPIVIADPDFDLVGDTRASQQQSSSFEAPSPPRPARGLWSRLLHRQGGDRSPGRNDRKQQPPPVGAVPASAHSRSSRDVSRSQLHFGRLPGTLIEGERIAAMLGVEPWIEGSALEARLKACRSPRILHLATHGFFLADQKRDPNEEQRGLGALSWEAGSLDRFSGRSFENPLLRSGLALAGVNTWLQNGPLPAEAEDGVLTAEDVTSLDLLDTELVVLSACETGLGDVRVGEGVFGLRRACVLAGAKTLVMSLWKVPDEQTQELMEDFYRRVLSGEPRAAALRQAQLAMQAKYPDPLYWGAFICQGDPGPLPPLQSGR